MDRRGFVASCAAAAACIRAAATAQAWAGQASSRRYPAAQLVDERGDPFRASTLRPLTNYVFHYPFEATPVFLLELGEPAAPRIVPAAQGRAYEWPGGVGPRHSIVAFSAICSHRLVYPTRDVSFISFRATRAQRGARDRLIHCCSEHSQYDPASGARVVSGPAPQPLCAVLLAHEPKDDTLVAYGTLGAELFDEFFRTYQARLSLEIGPRAHDAVTRAVVSELARFCRNTIQC